MNKPETENDKVIIFSQWDDLLLKTGKILKDNGILNTICRGNVSVRNKAIREINYNDKVKVILLSSNHCASGMNLTVANHIVMLEPIYGAKKYIEDIENQAISRSSRLGQTKSIKIMRFIIKDTIEHKLHRGYETIHQNHINM